MNFDLTFSPIPYTMKEQKGIAMERLFTYTISPADAGKTIEAFLREQGYSHRLLVSLKRSEDGICLNGKRIFTNYRLSENERLDICLREDVSSPNILPVPVPFSIVYEDDDLLIINKPADTPVHPSLGNYDNTRANGLADYFLRKNEPLIYRCINRLDRDTTGLLLVARHGLSAAVLSDQMTLRCIYRTYHALVEGIVPPEGTIDLPIGRKSDSLIERCIDPEHGETAITHFRTLRQCGTFSYVELHLETGRTHQIRVNMAAIGHPLIGDTLYNRDGIPGMKRQALHSYSLEFSHPITKEAMRFTAPLPDDMQSFLNQTALILGTSSI